MTDTQQVLLKLIKEIDTICAENEIQYIAYGRLALYAKRYQGFCEETGDNTVSIAMTSEDCLKFIDYFEKNGNPERYLESMLNSRNFPRVAMFYGDRQTLDFDVNKWGNYENHGIYVTIEILRKTENNKWRTKIYKILERGWEELCSRRSRNRRVFVYHAILRIWTLIMGKANVGKILFRMLVNPHTENKKSNYFLGIYKKSRRSFENYFFENLKRVPFEEHYINTSWVEEKYLEKTHGKAWETKVIPPIITNPVLHLVDASTPFEDYVKKLYEVQPDIEKLWKYKEKYDWKVTKYKEFGAKVEKIWARLFLAGERYNLYEYYLPRKLEIRELYRANDVEGLKEVLQPYEAALRKYEKNQLGLCFDEEIFKIMCYTLICTGAGKLAENVTKHVPAKHKKRIKIVDSAGKKVKMSVEAKNLRKADEYSVPAILAYLKQDVGNCVYMYIDIAKYGLENPNMHLWYDTDDEGINLVVMKYYDSISIYSRTDTWNLEEVCQLIKQEKVGMVSGQSWIIEKILPNCPEMYDYECGYVFKLEDFRSFDSDIEIQRGTVEEARKFAELICSNESIGGYYAVGNLTEQLIERMNTGMGRNLYIRKADGEIIAHIATYAECEGIAVTAGLIAHSDGSNIPYGTILESRLVRDLLDEGYQVYTFVTEKRRARFLTAVGGTEYGRYGKMVLKK